MKELHFHELKSLPNVITILRILSIPIFVLFLLSNLPFKDYIAAAIFIIISLTDALDGYIARKHKMVTGMGKFLDPVADKLLIASALIFLIGRIEFWMAAVIIARELLVTFARILFLPKKVIEASLLGKIKTISQIVAIVAVIINGPFHWWLMLIAVLITVISGADYLYKMAKLLDKNVATIPNMITLGRALLIPVFIWSLVQDMLVVAIIIFIIVTASDTLDGLFARMKHQITRTGKIFDAFTDLLFLFSSGLTFLIIGELNIAWFILLGIVTIVIAIVNGILFKITGEVQSNKIGKITVALYYVIVLFLLLSLPLIEILFTLVIVFAYSYLIIIVRRTINILRKKNKWE